MLSETKLEELHAKVKAVEESELRLLHATRLVRDLRAATRAASSKLMRKAVLKAQQALELEAMAYVELQEDLERLLNEVAEHLNHLSDVPLTGWRAVDLTTAS